MRRAVYLLALVVSTAAAEPPGVATPPLVQAFGGPAIDAVGSFRYRLTVMDDQNRVLRDARYVLAPGEGRLHVRDLRSPDEQVWYERQGTWRLAGDQLEFLGEVAARPYREHVAYHFLALLRDPATNYSRLSAERVRIGPAGASPFEAVLDPVTGLIRENHFADGVVGRELDYRLVGGVQWPMRFEIVAGGRLTRHGSFSETSISAAASLPALEPRHAQHRLPSVVADTARLIGAGWLSSARNDYNLTQDARGRMLVFARSERDFQRARIMVALREGDDWGTPMEAPFTDPRYRDSDPWLTPDGAFLYFISDRPTTGEAPRHDLDIWRVAVREGEFGSPEHLEMLSSDGEELGPEVHDGWLYFNSSRKGGPAKLSIYRARVVGNAVQAPEPLGAPFNDGEAQGDFTLSPDGQTALFWSTRAGSADGDLYAVRRYGTHWGTAVHLPSPINAAGFDFTPTFSMDGRELYFASMRRPAWLTDGEHVLNGEANLFAAPASIVDDALKAAAPATE